ncbi:MAG: MATE family efflux transporter [Clostridia bacterium]|nr:MATE family efflux transporter [Clostridia bacterium]
MRICIHIQDEGGSPVTEQSPALGSRAEKWAFYKHALWIMLPIALQNLMDTAVNTADVLMLSQVSQNAMSASSLAVNVSFILNNLIFGLSSASAVMAAQYWGKGDRTSVERVLGMSLRTGVLVSVLFALAAAVFPRQIMNIFTDKPELIEEGIPYLQVVSASYVMGSFAQIYLSVMRSVERVMMSAVVHCGAVLMNVLLNACFIFGIGPFPELEIVGVALATTVTRAVEMLICIIDGAACKRITLRVKYLFARGGQLMKDFLRLALPAASNDIVWGLAFSVYSVILGHLSSDIVAANTVASVIRNLGTVLCFGTASAAGIVLGKTMGENQLEKAKVYARRFIGMAVWTALIGGAVILLLRPLALQFMGVYVKDATDLARDELNLMLYINAYYIMGISLNTMLICGIFRAGGDVRYGLICDTLAMWGYAVPVGLLCAFVFKLPEMWVYFILCLDEFVKLPVNFWYYGKRKWLKNITRTQDAA